MLVVHTAGIHNSSFFLIEKPSHPTLIPHLLPLTAASPLFGQSRFGRTGENGARERRKTSPPFQSRSLARDILT